MTLDFNIPSQVRPYATFSEFPLTGAVKTIYIDEEFNKMYRWTGSAYVELSETEATTWGSITGDITSQNDLQLALDAKFDVPIGNTTQYLDGAGTPTTFPTMLSADKMVTIGRNATGSTLYKGTIVYILGSTGNRPNFVKAQANAESTSAGTFGVIENDIPNNADGNCVTIGTIDNLDTRASALHPFTIDTLVDGDTLYLSPLVAGYVTNVKPSAPYHMVYVGKVVRTSPTNGTIVYRIQNGYELNEIHDVAITSITNNDLIQYDSATSLWKNKSLSSAGIQSTLVSGTSIKTINSTSVLGSGDISVGTVTGVSATSPLSSTGGTTPSLTISQATTSTNGYLSSTDWNTFNGKQGALTLTTTGTSGAATLVGATLNIPQYSGGGGGLHFAVKPASNVYYTGQLVNGSTGSNQTTAANRMTFIPIIPKVSFTASNFVINVLTAAAGSLTKVLIYSNLNGLPSGKLYESTGLDCSTTGTKTVTASNFVFNADTTYWVGTISNQAGAAFTGFGPASCLPLGTNSVGGTLNFFSLAVNYTYSSPPTTIDSINTGFAAANHIGVWIQIA